MFFLVRFGRRSLAALAQNVEAPYTLRLHSLDCPTMFVKNHLHDQLANVH